MNQFVDNPVDIVLIMVFVLNAVLATLIFLNRKKSEGSFFFSLSAYATSLWVVAMFYFRQIAGIETLLLPTKTLYISGILIALFFFYFSYDFLGVRKVASAVRIKIFMITGILTGASVYLIVFSNTVIEQVFIREGNKIVIFGDWYYWYSIFMVICFLWSFTEFFKKVREFSPVQQLEKRQFVYIMIGTGISILAGLAFDIVLPVFGNFTFYWLGPVLTSIFVTFTAYSIFKHHLFSVKVIATELFVFLLWVLLLARTLLSSTWQEQLINGTLLIATLIFGTLLIRSVIKEVSQREKIEKLSEEKSEFMSFASHQIKGPLTEFKIATSMILEGDFGQISPELQNIVQDLYRSADHAVPMVQSFLDASKLEQEGGMTYNMAEVDLKKIVDEVIKSERVIAERKGLALNYWNTEGDNFKINADAIKIKQVVFNLIDNAIKYTSSGTIIVSLERLEKAIRFSIKDSGVGIAKEDMQRIFTKFGRGKGAEKVNVSSNGLGLYLAKQFVDAHHGKIWVESEGEGKGSTFFVELSVV